MGYLSYPLEVPTTAPTDGAGKDTRSLRKKNIQVDAPAGANWTIQIQGTIDGTTWATLGTYASAGGILSVPEAVGAVRVRTTAYVANAPTVVVGGYNARDEGA